MKVPHASWFVLFTTAPAYITTATIVVAAEQLGVQDNSGLRPRRNRQCPDGFGGNNCKQNIDECRRSPYPCTGGVVTGSFCVDFNPPEKFKCGCRTGYNALLPDALDVKDHVPVDWRPLKCIPKDVCVDVVCHEDATCNISSSNTASCICNDNLVGDGITSCSPPPPPPRNKPPSPQEQSRSCKVDSDCSKPTNAVCVEGVCKCKNGFYLSSGKGQCINENECADGFPNRCHRDAICTDTEGSYTCACKDGYQDLNSGDQAGTTCAQINECVSPSLHNCNTETQVCLDLPPPAKFQCVERTPAPTPAPTVCKDDGVTIVSRLSLKTDPSDFIDSYAGTCSSLSTTESTNPFCNCKGKYSFDATKNIEVVATNPNGALMRDVCCFCKSSRKKCKYDV